jgi:hypothetical protein
MSTVRLVTPNAACKKLHDSGAFGHASREISEGELRRSGESQKMDRLVTRVAVDAV